jgi:hypothetical protein
MNHITPLSGIPNSLKRLPWIAKPLPLRAAAKRCQHPTQETRPGET